MTIQVRDEYAPQFGRQLLTLWSGSFADCYLGSALELPQRNGYMVTMGGRKLRILCESPRTDENYQSVDAALAAVGRLGGAS
jgi:hypothetical protein